MAHMAYGWIPYASRGVAKAGHCHLPPSDTSNTESGRRGMARGSSERRSGQDVGGDWLRRVCFSLQDIALWKLPRLRATKDTPDGTEGPDPSGRLMTQGGPCWVPLSGQFKVRGNVKVKLLIMIAAVTASGLKPVLWLSCLVDILGELGIISRWLFQNDKGYQQPLSFFEEGLYAMQFAI